MHRLKRLYNDYIRREYGNYIGGDKNPERTDAVAQKVSALGISYEDFISVSVQLWHGWAISRGWKYPYWNVVVSDRTFERIASLIEYSDIMDTSTDCQDQFLLELGYAAGYVRWFVGEAAKPKRVAEADTAVKIAVAEYLCEMYGITCYTSNYNDVAKRLMESHGR